MLATDPERTSQICKAFIIPLDRPHPGPGQCVVTQADSVVFRVKPHLLKNSVSLYSKHIGISEA
ncbi:hypothetical protein F2P44_18640 [Massilia sp. CCM 8695]|uniref:Uncharacterized protein n=1 Tax=Massilia frigida TaxID=2609281 RepID=A0ABX0NGE9_9BURK|nr:hypothetical protein [Massilia frigida]NHZ81278.1 hypothetical protein [Massilia frigida]